MIQTSYASRSKCGLASVLHLQSSCCYSRATHVKSSISVNSYFGQKLPSQVFRSCARPRLSHSRRIQIIRAAIFGVGAPEALLVGVVALVVFGPKGLAQAVKSLGATLKTFSPTIRELASVTNDLSSTLQQQIGLDDIRNEFRNPPPNYYRDTDTASNDTASTSTAAKERTNSEKKEVEAMPSEDLEAKIADSKRMAWGGQEPEAASTKAVDLAPESQQATPQKASDLSIDELEAELKRRRDSAKKA